MIEDNSQSVEGAKKKLTNGNGLRLISVVDAPELVSDSSATLHG